MTDTRTLTRDAPAARPAEQPVEPKPRLFDVSATQLVGGALAAMTAAVIGAQLGVGGTVLGAAVGSIVAGVAGTLYTASLKHTKNRLAAVIVGRVGDTPVEIETVPGATSAPAGQTTMMQPAAVLAAPSIDPVATSAVVDRAGRPTRRLPWKPILVSTAAVFLLAVAGITGFELVSGQSVSGGEGTTLTQVSESRSGDTPTQVPSTDTSAEPSPESSSSASTEPSVEPSAPGTEPSAEPSASVEPSASSEPTGSEEPSTATGGEETEDTDTEGADTGAGAGG